MAYILIVDTDEASAEAAASALIDEGHACGWVNSGDKALALLEWRRPDHLAVARNLKGLSAPQLLREVRQSGRNHDLSVVFHYPEDPVPLSEQILRVLEAPRLRYG